MKNLSNSKKKILTILTIVALLVMIIPVAVMAKDGNFDLKPEKQFNTAASAAHDKQKPDVKDEEPKVEEPEVEEAEAEESESENKSERAEFVAERNALAVDLGIPAGHINLLYKLKDLEETSDDDFDVYLADLESGDMTIQEIMEKIKTARKADKSTGNEISKVAKEKHNSSDD